MERKQLNYQKISIIMNLPPGDLPTAYDVSFTVINSEQLNLSQNFIKNNEYLNFAAKLLVTASLLY